MRDSFGKPIGKTARVKKGQIIMSVSVLEEKIDIAKEALRRANAKLPGKTHIEQLRLKEKPSEEVEAS